MPHASPPSSASARSGYLLAILCGVLAAGAATLGKLSFGFGDYCLAVLPGAACEGVVGHLLLPGLLFGGMLLCNVVMVNVLAKSLNRTDSTASSMLLNNAANFLLTALLGWLFFRETLTRTWLVGAGLMLIGSFLINI
eukprot:gnl/Hemi2/15023_TR5071_c0_g1_i1.p2 gnl/Hemi2/15023_TR5071_c0_g1~~gnl/Hemi2/15023_TR5071_c0_g1_i1.p2  ORF type:complete len:153 (+),score=52.39 gnl/Hemi2/15023_TR5071_c0_g1_i1:46-459(+)